MSISNCWKQKWGKWTTALVLRILPRRTMEGILWQHRELINEVISQNRLTRPLIYGAAARVHLDETAVVNNAFFNTLGGEITVGPQSFFGHDVSLLTGTHDVQAVGEVRKESGGGEGRDITIRQGAWVATRAIVIGPCIIGENAVIGAGSVVLGDVEANAFYAGVPARKVKSLKLDPASSSPANTEGTPELSP